MRQDKCQRYCPKAHHGKEQENNDQSKENEPDNFTQFLQQPEAQEVILRIEIRTGISQQFLVLFVGKHRDLRFVVSEGFVYSGFEFIVGKVVVQTVFYLSDKGIPLLRVKVQALFFGKGDNLRACLRAPPAKAANSFAKSFIGVESLELRV